jgi:hypothetical protein
MKWPERVQTIVNKLAEGISHDAADEVRRATTRRIAEQCRFEFGPEWGHKRADPGRPPSADVFAHKTAEFFVGWDWSVPSGIAEFPESIDLSGQTFIDVEPINHLGGEPAPEPVPVPDPQFEARLARLEAAFAELWPRIINAGLVADAALGQSNVALEELRKPLSIEGTIGRSLYHSHSFSGEVKRG